MSGDLREHLDGPGPRLALGPEVNEPAMTVANVLRRALIDGASEIAVSADGFEWSGGEFKTPIVAWLDVLDRVLRRDDVIRSHLRLERSDGDRRVYRFT